MEGQTMSRAALDDALKVCKGSKALLASKLGVSRQVVWNWNRRGAVPKKSEHYVAVLSIAKEYRK